MHELSIALGILDLATEEARRHGDARVLAIHLKLGPLAGVVKEALQFSYDIARAGSPLEDAQLVIEDVPVAAYCPTCGGVRAVVSVQQLCCVVCGTPTGQVVSGQELEVVGLEIQ
jgi:hydrogenase nickel incorporation protein HypA/HybF